MARSTSRSAGQILAQAEQSIGTTLRVAVANYYAGRDIDTAETIRDAPDEESAAKIVTAIRQGRVHEVLMVAVGAAVGVASGALSQKALNNVTIQGVPPVAALGVVPAVAGLAAPLSLSGRSLLTTGGLSYITGALLYSMLTRPSEGAP